ncbi:hypothetical protein ABPG75_000832 [Micractinium tetrahymenae]
MLYELTVQLRPAFLCSAQALDSELSFPPACALQGSWTLNRFMQWLDPALLTDLRLEGIPSRKALLAQLPRFAGLTALELSSGSARLPWNTGEVVRQLPELRFLSLYSWGGTPRQQHYHARGPTLTALPPGTAEALPSLRHLTYLQLGAFGAALLLPQLTSCASLALQSLFDQPASAAIPPAPTRTDFPALTSFALDCDFGEASVHGLELAGCTLGFGRTLSYGPGPTASGQAAALPLSAELSLQNLVLGTPPGSTFNALLTALVPAGAALTSLTLKSGGLRQGYYDPGAPTDKLAVAGAALAQLRALSLEDCGAATLGALAAQAPALTALSFRDARYGYACSDLTAPPPPCLAPAAPRAAPQRSDAGRPARWALPG